MLAQAMRNLSSPWNLCFQDTKAANQSFQIPDTNGPRYKKEWPQRRWPGLSLYSYECVSLVCVCVSRSVQTGAGTPELGVSSLGSESSLTRLPSAWSMSALALCNLLLDAQLEGLSQGWVQRRVCRHLLTHPSWIIILRGGRVGKLRAWPLLERRPALSLDHTLTELRLTQGFLPVPVISRVAPVIVIFTWGPRALPVAR